MQKGNRMLEIKEKAVLDALMAKGGARRVEYRYEILGRNGAPKLVPEVESGWIGVDAARAVSRRGRFVFKDDARMDFAADTLRVTFRLHIGETYREWPLGRFYMTKAKRVGGFGAPYREIEAEDLSAALAYDEFTARGRFETGTPYTDAIRALLAPVTALPMIEESREALVSPIEFEIGESKLSAVSKLLNAIAFEPLFVTAEGRFVARRMRPPALRRAEFAYLDGGNCVITGETIEYGGAFDMPNVFRAVASRADAAMSYTAVIDEPSHPFAPQNRGGRRIVRTLRLPECASYDALVQAAEQAKAEARAEAGRVEFETLAMPHHETRDVYQLELPGAPSAKCAEFSWEMELAPGAAMRHVGGVVVRN